MELKLSPHGEFPGRSNVEATGTLLIKYSMYRSSNTSTLAVPQLSGIANDRMRPSRAISRAHLVAQYLPDPSLPRRSRFAFHNSLRLPSATRYAVCSCPAA